VFAQQDPAQEGFSMIRDIDFSVPTRDAATELIALCEAAGWAVDREKDVFHYEEGVPFSYGDDFDSYIPEATYTSVIAHKTGFVYDELSEIYAKADEIAAKVEGAQVTGGGTAFGEDEAPKIEDALGVLAAELEVGDVIPFVEDAQPIVNYIISQVGEDLPGMRDQAMEIRKLLVESGWQPPAPVEQPDRDALAAIVYRVNNPAYGDYGHHEVTAEAILRAGWTAPKAEVTE
jgi:hypothetical protein